MMRKLFYMHLANNIDDENMKLMLEILKKIDGDNDRLINSNELKEFVQK
jgi:hypothetical protein